MTAVPRALVAQMAVTTYLTTYRPGSPGYGREHTPGFPGDVNMRRGRPVPPGRPPQNLPFPSQPFPTTPSDRA